MFSIGAFTIKIAVLKYSIWRTLNFLESLVFKKQEETFYYFNNKAWEFL
jgi:hypothetical protein